ncbi:MAG TPA: hypothetical protein VFT85_04725 [Acidimicrobiia bacterium]|nr:hypothetical protein [Acidimicrobiia bacterium]
MADLEICPLNRSICISRGDTVPWTFTVLNSAGNPVDITGYTFLLTVDPSDEPGDALNNLFQLSGTLTDPTNGVVQFAMSAVQADQVPGIYYWDLQMTDTAGFIRTIAKGEFEFTQDITK